MHQSKIYNCINLAEALASTLMPCVILHVFACKLVAAGKCDIRLVAMAILTENYISLLILVECVVERCKFIVTGNAIVS